MKNYQNAGILRDICQKNAQILHDNWKKKYFFPIFFERKVARASLAPPYPSSTPMHRSARSQAF